MIKFSQKNVEKIEILNLIDDETLILEVSLTFQKKLNEQVLSYLKTFMNENPFTNDSDNINAMSDYLNNTSKVLKKSSSNLTKLQNLQFKLTSMRNAFDELEQPSSNFTKTQIEDYNKKYTETIEKITPSTIEIQTFLAQCQQDDILKKLLLEREHTRKSAKLENVNFETPKVLNDELPSSTESNNNDTITKLDDNIVTKLDDNDDIITKSDNNIITEFDVDIYPELSQKEGTEIDTSELLEKQPHTEEDSNIESSENSDSQNDMNIIETDNQDLGIETKTNSIDETSNKINSSENTVQTEITSKTPNIVENTLIISEKNGNVILPYTLEELNDILKKNPYKYDNIEDIIEKKYTKSIKYYKNSSIARFKETFKLVRERGSGSLKHAWDLSLEAFFNYDLHPAIISACKSIDELDIYLSCLEYDELEDFRFFKIIFDILPTLSKKKKSNI